MTFEDQHKEQPYGQEWLTARAFNGLRKIDDTTFDFSDSLLLYLPGADEAYQDIQEVDTPYHKLVTAPERAYLETIASRMVAQLPQEFEYIDLGPGTEHKEQFIFDAASAQGKTFTYRPVDTNERYLGSSEEYAAKQGIIVDKVRSAFEELAKKLGPATKPRFVSLGLTYSNYPPKEILDILTDIAGEHGFIFVESQLRERIDIDAVADLYSHGVYPMFDKKLLLIGLDPKKDIEKVETDDGIRVWCTLRNSTPKLEALGIHPGTKLLVFQSLRPTEESFKADVAGMAEKAEFLEEGSTFLGALIKT